MTAAVARTGPSKKLSSNGKKENPRRDYPDRDVCKIIRMNIKSRFLRYKDLSSVIFRFYRVVGLKLLYVVLYFISNAQVNVFQARRVFLACLSLLLPQL